MCLSVRFLNVLPNGVNCWQEWKCALFGNVCWYVLHCFFVMVFLWRRFHHEFSSWVELERGNKYKSWLEKHYFGVKSETLQNIYIHTHIRSFLETADLSKPSISDHYNIYYVYNYTGIQTEGSKLKSSATEVNVLLVLL